jgi:hypothetical protein
MQSTKVYPGYGGNPLMETGGMMPGPSPEAMGMAAPPQPEGPMAELQPMVQAYLSNPDPALAEEIIMALANAMGVAPATPPAAPMASAGNPMGAGPTPGGAPTPFEKGGKIPGYLSGLKLV